MNLNRMRIAGFDLNRLDLSETEWSLLADIEQWRDFKEKEKFLKAFHGVK